MSQPRQSPASQIQSAAHILEVLAEEPVEERGLTEEPARRLAAIVDSAEDAIISKDVNGVIRTWNAAAERMFGYAAPEIIGKPVLTLIPEDRHHEEEDILARIRRGERVEHFETVRRRKDGGLIDISLTISPIRDAHGRVIGASKIARDITDRKRWQRILQRQTHRLATLNQVARELSKDLDLDRIVRTAIDLATDLSDAQFGAFFYIVGDEARGPQLAHAVAGERGEDFARLVAPAPNEQLSSVLRAWRTADLRNDAHYRKHAPFRGLTRDRIQIVSYLAVPVVSASGQLQGGLVFGHDQPGVFTVESEHIVAGIAAQAGMALENAKLHRHAKIEIEHRRKAEADKQLLLNEIRHRIKNTLSMVQAMARQTLHGVPQHDRDAFVARLHAMNEAHDLLTQRDWRSASLSETVERAMRPFGGLVGRVSADGPEIELAPNKSLLLAMLLHELGTNALKYGALSGLEGCVRIDWKRSDADGRQILCMTWRESGGPKVVAPERKGFGSRLLERALGAEQGSAELFYDPEGFHCTLRIPV